MPDGASTDNLVLMIIDNRSDPWATLRNSQAIQMVQTPGAAQWWMLVRGTDLCINHKALTWVGHELTECNTSKTMLFEKGNKDFCFLSIRLIY